MYKAQAIVETAKASRYLKALCNHFDRKVTAEYDDNHGNVDFGFGNCQMVATENTLSISIQADDEEQFAQVKFVIADHLERFSGDEALKSEWVAGISPTE
ncbi:MAG: DUF2218 domain-containing protein [Aggregatilineales bacterium]